MLSNTRSDKTTYTDDGSMAELEAAETRHYRVSAINSAGAGTPSEMGDATTPENAANAPGEPTGLMAMAMGSEQIDLSWTAPSEDGGDEVTGYMIQFANLNTTDGSWSPWINLVDDTDSTDTTFSDDGDDDRYETTATRLMAETIRQYRVAALNSNEAAGTSSTPTNATTGEAEVPGAPMMLKVTPSGPTMVMLRWDPPTDLGGSGITGYQIERSERASSWPAKPLVADTTEVANTADLTYTDNSVPKADTRWYYRVAAINEEGTGTMTSNVASGFTYPAVAPKMPTALTAWEEGPSRVVLTWKAPKDTGGTMITGYRVEYSDDADDADDVADASWMELVANTGNMATMYIDNGSIAELEAGVKRHYRVSAINSVGRSAGPSIAFSAITGTIAFALMVDGPVSVSHAENGRDTMATYMASGSGSEMATWSLSGDDMSAFTIRGGMLMFKASPDYENPMDMDDDNTYMVTVEANVVGNNAAMRTVTVIVTNEIELGTLTGTASVDYAENDTVAVGTYTADGPVTPAWSLSGDDADDFSIGSGMLMFRATPDFMDAVTVMAEAGGEMGMMDVMVTVTDQAELGMLMGEASVEYMENGTAAVGTYTADGSGTASWSLEGDDMGAFTIGGSSGELMFAMSPDFEAPTDMGMDNMYMVTVMAKAGGEMDMMDVTVMVTNVKEDGTVSMSPERPGVGDEVTAMLTDPDGMVSSSEMWQWSKSMDMTTWMEIEDATMVSYTPVAADNGYYLRATVNYTDGYGSDMAMADSMAAVSSIAIQGMASPPDYAEKRYGCFGDIYRDRCARGRSGLVPHGR